MEDNQTRLMIPEFTVFCAKRVQQVQSQVCIDLDKHVLVSFLLFNTYKLNELF